MKILIVDKFDQKRDLAQAHIYNFLLKNFNCTFVSEPDDFSSIQNYNIIYLGIYHQTMLWADSESKIYLANKIIQNMNSNQLLIVDQADSEIFIRNDNKINFLYKNFIGKKILFDRYNAYLPLKNFAKENNFTLVNLPWAFDIGNLDENFYDSKDIDVAFISSVSKTWKYHSKRMKILKNIQKFKKRHKQFSVYISAPPLFPENIVYGEEYLAILKRTKIFLVESSGRYCLTQKYLEAGLSKCIILGDLPQNPNNNIFLKTEIMFSSDITKYSNMKKDLIYLLSNSEIISQKTNECFNQIKLHHNINNIMSNIVKTHFPKTK